ncbi:hypothetical protein HN51_061898 [Arachis hypogaea]
MEKLDGLGGEGVGELEDLLDIGGSDREGGIVERLLDGVKVSGGDDVGEDFDSGGEGGGGVHTQNLKTKELTQFVIRQSCYPSSSSSQ